MCLHEFPLLFIFDRIKIFISHFLDKALFIIQGIQFQQCKPTTHKGAINLRSIWFGSVPLMLLLWKAKTEKDEAHLSFIVLLGGNSGILSFKCFDRSRVFVQLWSQIYSMAKILRITDRKTTIFRICCERIQRFSGKKVSNLGKKC